MWTDGGDGSANTCVAFHEGRTSEVSAVNVAMLLEGKSTHFRAVRYLTYSDDGLNWDTPSAFGSTVTTANAWQYASTWETVLDTKRYFRAGILGKNASGQTGNVEMATATVIVDLKPR